jgi:hypothetical protein
MLEAKIIDRECFIRLFQFEVECTQSFDIRNIVRFGFFEGFEGEDSDII